MLFASPKRRIEKYLRRRPEVKTILVMGSYGRSSALRALGEVLGRKLSLSFGVNPALDPDVILLDYRSFGAFPDIEPDIAVITSCLDEESAKTFFSLANRAKHVYLGIKDIPEEYSKYLSNPAVTTYGDDLPANYYYEEEGFDLNGYTGSVVASDSSRLTARVHLLGEHNVRAIVMAAAVARQLGLPATDIAAGIEAIRPLHGRMSPAKGLRGSIVIDDSADTSAMSVRYGLNTICHFDGPSRILVTDNAEKLRGHSLEVLSEILVLGNQSKHALADAKIRYFATDLDLMQYLGGRLEAGTIVLLETPLPEIIEAYQQ